jgi:hypothetical protein
MVVSVYKYLLIGIRNEDSFSAVLAENEVREVFILNYV